MPQTATLPDQPPYIRYPRAAQPASFNARAVAKAYGAPVDRFDGTGVTIGVIELGGAYSLADLQAAGVGSIDITPVAVDGAAMVSDPQGADGEVALDVQVIAAVAPKAKQRVYFAANTDRGFSDAVKLATAECDLISISWGGPENAWSGAAIRSFSAVCDAARKKGVTVFAAAGDNGSSDGTRANVTDYPASDPHVVGCGGTRLTVSSDGSRTAETVWNDNPTQSATGGGVSKVFPGRSVPDVAGDADPDTGYEIVVAGQRQVIGGTSAVAPLYAAMTALLKQATGKAAVDFLNVVSTNPTVCYDVVQGNNGGYRAGPGRDSVSGFGVVDFGKLLAILTSGTQVPAPGGGPGGAGGGGTTPAPGADLKALLREIAADLSALAKKILTALGGGS